MIKVLKIDNEGCFIEDVLIEENESIPSDCIETPCPEGFYKPKWNGGEWVEGLTQDEINKLKNVVQPPTLEEQVVTLSDAITALMGV